MRTVACVILVVCSSLVFGLPGLLLSLAFLCMAKYLGL
jgi:hypothetical protein